MTTNHMLCIIKYDSGRPRFTMKNCGFLISCTSKNYTILEKALATYIYKYIDTAIMLYNCWTQWIIKYFDLLKTSKFTCILKAGLPACQPAKVPLVLWVWLQKFHTTKEKSWQIYKTVGLIKVLPMVIPFIIH